MFGTMQHWPLLAHKILDHAAIQHPNRAVISRSVEGPIHRTTYGAMHKRSRQVAKRLTQDGIKLGDRVATLAWNTWRQHGGVVRAFWALGRSITTVNPRLFPDQIAWIINDAADRMLFVDLTFVPLVEKLMPALPTIEKVVILTDAAHMPATSIPNAVAYESYIAPRWMMSLPGRSSTRTPRQACATRRAPPAIPRASSYSHRSNVLHAWMAATPDMLGISAKDVVMPVVPAVSRQWLVTSPSPPLSRCCAVMPGAKLDGRRCMSFWRLRRSR